MLGPPLLHGRLRRNRAVTTGALHAPVYDVPGVASRASSLPRDPKPAEFPVAEKMRAPGGGGRLWGAPGTPLLLKTTLGDSPGPQWGGRCGHGWL